MGADLYIKSISDERKKQFEPLFEAAVRLRDLAETEVQRQIAQEQVHKYYDEMYADGYFRDSYNLTSVMARMELSWWNDVGPMLSKKTSNLSPRKAKRLLEIIRERQIQALTVDEIRNAGGTIDDGENTIANWVQFWIDQRLELIAFLEKAISLKEPVYCSI